MQRMLTVLAPLLAALLLAACSGPTNTSQWLPAPEFRPVEVLEPAVYPFIGGSATQTLEFPRVWFVEVDAPAAVDGGSIATLSHALATVQTAAADAGIALEPRYVFSTFVSGFSTQVEPGDLLRLASLPGVVRLTPVGIVDPPQVTWHDPSDITPQMATAVDMTGASTLQGEGVTGNGIKVGIIDTGILLDHPEFGGRVTFGYDFVGDYFDAGDPANDVPLPEGTPDAATRPGGGDCNGHGTHVAGIVGAGLGGTVTGVAPAVDLGAYRVFGCAGSSHTDVILSAIERAFADGMDVVNLSLGSNNGWPQDFLSIALGRMLAFGMIPVASAGNNGANGLYTIGSPGAGADVITVASFDNTNVALDKMTVDGDDIGYQNLTGVPEAPKTGTAPEIVYVGQGCDADDYLADPTGKVALVTRGACTFAEKYSRAFDEGAVGVVIENNAPGNFAGTLGGTSTLGFGVTISGANGDLIKAAIDADAAPFITWTDEMTIEENPTGNLISGFSSYGLAPDLSLKPDIGAPGGLIFSTMISNAVAGDTASGTAGYAVLSGTSMSAPHVAGAVALLLDARPDISRDRVRDVMMNTASPQLWFGNPGLGFLDSVHRQGAGMLQIDAAAATLNYAVPAKLSLGESANGAFVDVITLHNDTGTDVTYLLGDITSLGGTAPIATTGASSDPGFALSIPSVQYFKLVQSSFYQPIDEITVPAGGTASFEVRITANPGSAQGTIYGTYLVFLPDTEAVGALPIVVPAAGYVGDYQRQPVVSFEPALVALFPEGLFLVPPGYAFSMQGVDVPFFAIGLAHPTEKMTVTFLPTGERSWIGTQPGFEVDLMRRNNTGELYAFGLGDFDASGLPDGEYTMRVRLVKALGDPTNPSHVVTLDTPNFVIQRP